jgi:hypothetical protein
MKVSALKGDFLCPKDRATKPFCFKCPSQGRNFSHGISLQKLFRNKNCVLVSTRPFFQHWSSHKRLSLSVHCLPMLLATVCN